MNNDFIDKISQDIYMDDDENNSFYNKEYLYHWTSKKNFKSIDASKIILSNRARNPNARNEVKAVFLTCIEDYEELHQRLGSDIYREVRITIPLLKLNKEKFSKKHYDYDDKPKILTSLRIIKSDFEVAYLDDIDFDASCSVDFFE